MLATPSFRAAGWCCSSRLLHQHRYTRRISRMNRNRLLRALFTLALLILAGGSALAQGKVEVVGGDRYDWGRVAPGNLTATIVVRNAGTGVLNISRVQPGCGCTS